jgi:hypothetical protein
VLSEGLPVESYLGMQDGRTTPTVLALCGYPNFSARMWDAFGCARPVVTGMEYAAARGVDDRVTPAQAAAWLGVRSGKCSARSAPAPQW